MGAHVYSGIRLRRAPPWNVHGTRGASASMVPEPFALILAKPDYQGLDATTGIYSAKLVTIGLLDSVSTDPNASSDSKWHSCCASICSIFLAVRRA